MEEEVKKKLEETLLKKHVNDSDIKAWNDWVKELRKTNPGIKIPVNNIILEDKDFLGKTTIDFSNCTFTKCIFKNVVFPSGTDFTNSEFKGSKMSSCFLSCSNFTGFKDDEKSKISLNKYIDCIITPESLINAPHLSDDQKKYHVLKGVDCENLGDNLRYKKKASEIKWNNKGTLGKLAFNFVAPSDGIDVINFGIGFGSTTVSLSESHYCDNIIQGILPGIIVPPSSTGLKWHNCFYDMSMQTNSTNMANMLMIGPGFITPDKNIGINLGIGGLLYSIKQDFVVAGHNEKVTSGLKFVDLGARFGVQWKVSKGLELEAITSTSLNFDGSTYQYNKFYGPTPHTVETSSHSPVALQLNAKLNIPIQKPSKKGKDEFLPVQIEFSYNHMFNGTLEYSDPSVNFKEKRTLDDEGFCVRVNLAIPYNYGKKNQRMFLEGMNR